MSDSDAFCPILGIPLPLPGEDEIDNSESGPISPLPLPEFDSNRPRTAPQPFPSISGCAFPSFTFAPSPNDFSSPKRDLSNLPPEIRNMIYDLTLFEPTTVKVHGQSYPVQCRINAYGEIVLPGLVSVNRLFRQEGYQIALSKLNLDRAQILAQVHDYNFEPLVNRLETIGSTFGIPRENLMKNVVVSLHGSMNTDNMISWLQRHRCDRAKCPLFPTADIRAPQFTSRINGYELHPWADGADCSLPLIYLRLSRLLDEFPTTAGEYIGQFLEDCEFAGIQPRHSSNKVLAKNFEEILRIVARNIIALHQAIIDKEKRGPLPKSNWLAGRSLKRPACDGPLDLAEIIYSFSVELTRHWQQ